MSNSQLYEIGELNLRFSVSLRQTVYSHGWVQLAPWEWIPDQHCISRKESLDGNNIVSLCLLQVTPKSFVIKSDKCDLNQNQVNILKRRASRWISGEWNPEGAMQTARRLNSHIALYLKQGGGRFLRSSTFYEDLIKTICTINTNWASTVHMIKALVSQSEGECFPNPTQVSNLGSEFLKKNTRMGFRSDVVYRVSRFFAELNVGTGLEDDVRVNLTKEGLLNFKGLGPYSANHMMMLSLDFSSIPIDSEVSSYCKEWYGLGPHEIEAFFDPWGEYKVLGYKLDRTLRSQKWRDSLK